MLKDFLISPGPTQVPHDILAAMAEPLYHHRTPKFSSVLVNTIDLLKQLYRTKEEVYILSSSGTGGMEAAVVNTLSAGDKAIVVRSGKFGERWGDICEAYNVTPFYIDVNWGSSVLVSAIKNAFQQNPDAKALFIQYCETSTGAQNPVKEIASFVKSTDAIFVVDAITALGVSECPVDEWNIDIAVCGSQKSLMLPPGLAFISFSAKARELAKSSTLPKLYFDLKQERKALKNNTTAWTPAVSLIIGLNRALSRIVLEEGLNNVIARHALIAEATRKGVKALGLELFADNPANSVTSVKVPADIDGAKIPKLMRDKYGVAIAGGQSSLKGKIFRIGHIGYIEKSDLAIAFQALEFTLKDLGYEFAWGASLKAIQSALYDIYKNIPIRTS